MTESLESIAHDVVECRRCPRLVVWRRKVAEKPPRRFRAERYWAKPLPAFGDPTAHILVVGLAPAAHGGNRTGRIFTGDASGDFLFRALFETGLANQPVSVSRRDGLALSDVLVTAAARCAPPGNRPTPREFQNCRLYLEREIAALPDLRVIVPLGALAFQATLQALRAAGHDVPRPRPRFEHRREIRIGPYIILASYHPSQQNTFTGKLTREMLRSIFRRARASL